jgi:hypothetical protein
MVTPKNVAVAIMGMLVLGVVTSNYWIANNFFTSTAGADQTPGIIYVKWDANGNNDGTSWWDAFRALDDGIAKAKTGYGDEIWVARGTYTPSQDHYYFEMVSNVGIYGGFAGNETSRDQRNWESNETILDKDGRNDIGTMVKANGVVNAVLDGFIIRNTNTGIEILNNSSTTIRNTRVTGMTGWGINTGGSSTTNIINCDIKRNVGNGIASYGAYGISTTTTITGCTVEDCNGTGINSTSKVISISDCIIKHNGWGTAYSPTIKSNTTFDASVTIKNSKIYNNKWDGIVIVGNDSAPQVQIINNWICNNGDSNYPDNPASGICFNIDNCCYSNSIVRGNTIAYNTGYGIDRRDSCWCGFTSCDSTLTITDCILFFNEKGTVPQYSLPWNESYPYYCYDITFSSGDDGNVPEGGGNIHDAPGFVDAENNNYHLRPDSPCINAGDPDYVLEPNETDIDSEPRVMNGRVDIGADEILVGCATCPGDLDGDGWVTPNDLALMVNILGAFSESEYMCELGTEGCTNWCADLDGDGWVTLNDLSRLVIALQAHSESEYMYQCGAVCLTCPGDLDGDGWVTPNDLALMLNILGAFSESEYQCELGTEGCTNYCADLDGDGWITPNDLAQLVNILIGAGPENEYEYQCP